MATDVTVTIKSAGGDYSGILDFLTNYPTRDLVTADTRVLIECDNFEDALAATAADFDSGGAWTTDDTRYLHFYPAQKHGSTGRVTTSAYRITGTAANMVQLGDLGSGGKIVFEGIQFKNTATGRAVSDTANIAVATAKEVYLDRCVIEAAGNYGVYNNDDKANWTLTNCFVIGTTAAVRHDANANMTIMHCTLYAETGNGYAQNSASADALLYNTYIHGVTDCINIFSGTNSVKTKVATSNTDGDIQNVAFSVANFTNVTLDSEDLHLVVGATDLIGTGTDLSANSWPKDCALDIDCGTRAAAAPDVGADEYGETGSLPSPGGAAPATPPPEHVSPENTFRDDFPYHKAVDYYQPGDSAPPPPDIHDWIGGAGW
jgi:hypothetical protein